MEKEEMGGRVMPDADEGRAWTGTAGGWGCPAAGVCGERRDWKDIMLSSRVRPEPGVKRESRRCEERECTCGSVAVWRRAMKDDRANSSPSRAGGALLEGCGGLLYVGPALDLVLSRLVIRRNENEIQP